MTSPRIGRSSRTLPPGIRTRSKELENLFWIEASKYQVLPLDATVATRLVQPRPNLAAGRTEFTWSGEVTGTPNGDAPSILNASYNFKAEVEMPDARALGLGVEQAGDGMIVTQAVASAATGSMCSIENSCSFGTWSTSSACDGKALMHSHPANTPWSSTLSTTASVPARLRSTT